eukprot:1146305-Pelagomonas_calceolata.AAC.12
MGADGGHHPASYNPINEVPQLTQLESHSTACFFSNPGGVDAVRHDHTQDTLYTLAGVLVIAGFSLERCLPLLLTWKWHDRHNLFS